jgi:hypothetical protein
MIRILILMFTILSNNYLYSKKFISAECLNNYNIVYIGLVKIKIAQVPIMIVERENKVFKLEQCSFKIKYKKKELFLSIQNTEVKENPMCKIGELQFTFNDKKKIEVYNYKQYKENLYLIILYHNNDKIQLIFKREDLWFAKDVAENLEFLNN